MMAVAYGPNTLADVRAGNTHTLVRATAALAALWFEQAGWHISVPVLATEVAREGAAAAGILAAAIDLRNLLAQSSDGRKALSDLGFQPVLQQVEGE
jgi:hypothetical protein